MSKSIFRALGYVASVLIHAAGCATVTVVPADVLDSQEVEILQTPPPAGTFVELMVVECHEVAANPFRASTRAPACEDIYRGRAAAWGCDAVVVSRDGGRGTLVKRVAEAGR